MEYKELLEKRRSIRDYEDKKVSMETITEILKDACLAPSACNTQPWRFIVIQNKQLMTKISNEAKRYGLTIMEKYPDSPYCMFKNVFTNPDYNIFFNAPVLIYVVGQKNYPFFAEDCTCAVNYLMFAATERNLGTCWIGHAHFIEDKILKNEIGIPEDHEIAAAIILGYPKSIPKSRARNELTILNTIIED